MAVPVLASADVGAIVGTLQSVVSRVSKPAGVFTGFFDDAGKSLEKLRATSPSNALDAPARTPGVANALLDARKSDVKDRLKDAASER